MRNPARRRDTGREARIKTLQNKQGGGGKRNLATQVLGPGQAAGRVRGEAPTRGAAPGRRMKGRWREEPTIMARCIRIPSMRDCSLNKQSGRVSEQESVRLFRCQGRAWRSSALKDSDDA
ncbi:hypothetical protein NDU88_008057 [Pleurodeles waltl]|uniref:Uncharacterized protein n=1 Tax=Pleurodeles waltl TaxID=8319 RepID=A0AAV7NUU7_PLEWA|nr:hypothetical protein NDU88_008057 [Pleurodeles waltl]